MLFLPRTKPIVFGGPSLKIVRSKYPTDFDYRTPIQRNDLHMILKNYSIPGCVLITDGIFGNRLAVTPVECMDFIEAGWLLLGSSSIGALRAADCNDMGMIGIGDIFMGYQMGYYHSDADVAVIYQDESYDELTVSMVHADSIAKKLVSQDLLTYLQYRVIIKNIRKIPWHRRSARKVSKIFDSNLSKEYTDLFLKYIKLPESNPKKNDAILACDYIYHYYLKK